MTQEFEGKRILITGAGKGIGFSLAETLHQMGAQLILHSVSDESMGKLRNQFGSDQQVYFQADFAAPNDLEAQWKDQVASDIRIDGYVNCVGIRSRKPINLLTPGAVMAVMAVNFVSYLEMIRLITRKGAFNPGLSIVGVSSIAAHTGGAGVSAYAGSKAAMEAGTRCLARELYKKEIRLNTVVCGQVETEAYQALIDSKADGVDKILERQYLGLGKPAQIADIILFLLSEKSAFITGSSIPADGGYLSS